mmetsp:Transcript_33833/g.67021  ORF Transcript_33833/g.67021 Transcript_33833/m.67021 type:complete len:200 (-) Transcript_33833:153-752(-)
MRRLQNHGVLPHTQVVVGAPDLHHAFRLGLAECRVGEVSLVTLQVGEDSVVSFLVQFFNRPVEVLKVDLGFRLPAVGDQIALMVVVSVKGGRVVVSDLLRRGRRGRSVVVSSMSSGGSLGIVSVHNDDRLVHLGSHRAHLSHFGEVLSSGHLSHLAHKGTELLHLLRGEGEEGSCSSRREHRGGKVWSESKQVRGISPG